MMRCFQLRCLRSVLSLLFVLLCFTAACEERPIDVLPETHYTTWQRYGPEEPDRFTGIEGTSASNIYATTYQKLMHYDGNRWNEIQAPGNTRPLDLWIASDNEIYVLTSRALLLYDGLEWATVYEQDRCCLQKIWGSAADDMYITAGNKILHFDGSSWSADTLSSGSWTLSLYAIWGAGATDIYAAGQIEQSNEVIYRNDGSGWAMMYFGNIGRVNVLWGSGADDVYAAGFDHLLHCNGDSWEEVSLPQPVPYLTEVWGTGRNDVWVFYSYAGSGISLCPSGMMHFDGVDWEHFESPTSMMLTAAWGASADDIFAVGYAGKMVRYDGSKWISLSGGYPPYAVCLWGFDSGEIFAADVNSVFRYRDGEITEFTDACGVLRTWDLWGTSPSFLVSAGLEGRIFIYNGSSWTRASIAATSNFTAVSGVSEDAVWAVGLDGMCFFYDGSEWVQLYEHGGMSFWDVWPASKTCAFVVGNEGTIVRFDGSAPTFFNTGINKDLHAVWGTSSSNVFAAGKDGVILHFDGNEWKRMAVPDARGAHGAVVVTGAWKTFQSIIGRDNEDVTAIDNAGYAVHYNGVVWNGVVVDRSESVSDVWLGPDGRIFASGYKGLYVMDPDW